MWSFIPSFHCTSVTLCTPENLSFRAGNSILGLKYPIFYTFILLANQKGVHIHFSFICCELVAFFNDKCDLV